MDTEITRRNNLIARGRKTLSIKKRVKCEILWLRELFEKVAYLLYFEFTAKFNIKGKLMQGKISMDFSFCLWGVLFYSDNRLPSIHGISLMIERVMREPRRRIRKIAYGWSDIRYIKSCMNHTETICKRPNMGGLSAKRNEYHRQCRYRHREQSSNVTKLRSLTEKGSEWQW